MQKIFGLPIFSTVWLPGSFLRLPVGITVLDLGTGGGLPGVPLAILRSDLRVVLLDSVAKKTAALAEIVRDLGLGNAEVLTGRAEERSFQQTFRCDVVIARAVASLVELIRWSRPLLKQKPPATTQAFSGGSLSRHTHCDEGGDLAGEIRQARIKIGDVPIREISLSFEGSHEAGLVEKKLVLVTLG